MNRRRFLTLVGASALTYPFLRGLPSYAAGNNGSSTGEPPFLVLLFTSCGCVRYRWGAQGPAPAGMTDAVTSPLVFRQTLSAFTKAGPQQQADLTNYVTVLDGLQVKGAGGGSHETGMAALWTGLNVGSNNAPGGPTIDQVISGQLASSTPLPNVALMVQSSADYQQRQVDTRMLYDAAGNFVDPITSPADALAKIFQKGTTPDAGPSPKQYIRQKVAAEVNQELTALQSRLCTEDRQQLQNLQNLYNQTLMQMQAAAAAAASCMVPSIDGGAADGGGGGGCTDPFPMYADAMANILAMTLACNLTQVASLQYSHALSPVTHCWLGSSQTQTHHNFSHNGPSYIGALAPDPYVQPPTPYPQQLMDIESWYGQKVADLAYLLSTLGPTGNTILDRSVICWGSEIDMGNAHNHDNTPFVLMGGGGGKLKTSTSPGGLLVRFPMLPLTNANNNACGLRFHNDLLITLAQIMGVSTDQLQKGYGSSWSSFNGYVSKPISEILA